MSRQTVKGGRWLAGAVLATFASLSGAVETKKVLISEIWPGDTLQEPGTFSIVTKPKLRKDCPKVRIPWLYREDVHKAQLEKQPIRLILSSGECIQFGDSLYLNALGVVLSNDDPVKDGRTKIGAPVDNGRPVKPKKN